jgi:hypothetical protein
MNHSAKIAIYMSDTMRYIDLYWNERTDSVVIKEDGHKSVALVKPDATLMDALVALGYNDKMTLDFYEPSFQSLRDKKDHLNSLLLTCYDNRIVLSQVGCCFAGKPAMVGW